MFSNPSSPTSFKSARRFRPIAVVLLALLSFSTVALVQRTSAGPVKIFIMAGQSNTQGHGELNPSTTTGTLSHLVANDPEGKYQFLLDGANWKVRDDVLIHYQRNVPLGSGVREGGLTVGYGANSGNVTSGPELGFGHVLGDVHESKILLIKTCWGGKSLGVDFLPPSSESYPTPTVEGDKGFFYEKILEIVSDVTTNIASHVPGYSGEGYEISGFAWHQGWNDRVTSAFAADYETNMANFINDIRSDLGVSDLPFVIASSGMDGLDGYGYTTVEKAQLKMADATAYPAFVGNVSVIDARSNYEGLDFWQGVSASPASQGYHWNRNAKTYLHIGQAMGDAMSLLAPGRCPYRLRASGGSGGVTLTWENGTEMPDSVRVLRNGVQIAAVAPVSPSSFVDATAPLGVNNYELQFTMPVTPCGPLSLSHNSGITGLQANRLVNGLNLSWQNNLNYTSINVLRNGVVIAAAISGNANGYVDSSPPAGLVTYSVVPTDSGSTPAEVQTDISAASAGTAVIYEPFDMTAATSLNEKAGGIGLEGQWVAGSTVQVTSGNLSFGTLPTFGNHIERTSGNGSCSINIGTTLADAGLLADGADLWFSFLHPNPNNINVQPIMVLGNETVTGSSAIANGGSGIGAKINQGKSPQPIVFNAGTSSTGTVQTTLGASETALIVCHITWGADGSAPDTIRIYTPGTDLVLDTPQSTSAVVDQSTFHVLSMWGNATAPAFDEIRFGASYDNVIGLGVDTSGDHTLPTPVMMSFDSAPNAISDTAITMTAAAASDANGVEYYFTCTAGGGNNSNWQDSPVYTDTGLTANTLYSYKVQARDKSVNYNTNTASSDASATTDPPDINPPATPAFAIPPAATSSTAITMTASAVTDPEGSDVQYYFTCTAGGGNDSDWQTGLTYIDTGLTPETEYTYTVKARDMAAVPNESDPSGAVSATTPSGPSGPLVYEPFDYTPGSLHGAGGTSDFGFSDNWNVAGYTSDTTVGVDSLFGTYATLGNSIVVPSGSANRNGGSRTLSSALSDANLLDDGATLWFSAVVGYGTGGNATNTQLSFALGNDRFNGYRANVSILDDGAQTGAGVGVRMGRFTANGQCRAVRWTNANSYESGTVSPAPNLGGGEYALVVGKITWGAGPTDFETIELFKPGADLLLPTTPVSTLTTTVALDQTTFDTITWCYGDKVVMDEIRFGASYADVTPVDATDPLLTAVSPQGAGDPPLGNDGLFRATFDEPVVAAATPTGSIVFRNAGDDTAYTTIPVTDGAQVSFDGLNLDITPTLLPVPGNSYYIEIEPGAVEDSAGNPFAGFTGSATWSFTADSTPPVATFTNDSANGGVFLSLQPTVTYTLSFDEFIGTSLSTADFSVSGTATATVDSVTQNSDTTVTVVVTASTLGTIQLDVLGTADFPDLLGNTLSGPFSDPGTVTVQDVSLLESQLGILDLTANNGVNPATGGVWQAGDTYRFAFVTSAVTTAESTDITYYNTFVNDAADSASALAGLGTVEWKAIASTATVDARDNTSTNTGVNGSGEGIFQTNSAIVANDYADLWDGTTNRIFFSEKGTDRVVNEVATSQFSGQTGVWTGTNGSGTKSSELGVANSRLGLAKDNVSYWISRATRSKTETLAVYALSEALTVGAVGGGSAFDTWAAGPFASTLPLTDPSASLDFDGGGLETGIEWVVGGDPTDGGDDAGNAPTGTDDGTYLVYTYNRSDESNDDANTTITVEYGSGLTGWTTAEHGTAGVIITVTDSSPFDIVEVKIPKALAVGAKLFARLNVLIAP